MKASHGLLEVTVTDPHGAGRRALVARLREIRGTLQQFKILDEETLERLTKEYRAIEQRLKSAV